MGNCHDGHPNGVQQFITVQLTFINMGVGGRNPKKAKSRKRHVISPKESKPFLNAITNYNSESLFGCDIIKFSNWDIKRDLGCPNQRQGCNCNQFQCCLIRCAAMASRRRYCKDGDLAMVSIVRCSSNKCCNNNRPRCNTTSSSFGNKIPSNHLC